MSARAITMDGLASRLSPIVERPVINRTGLSGIFDVDLTHMPLDGPVDRTAGQASNAPSIFTAVQERLGLKLEPDRAAVEVLVVDRVEPPTEKLTEKPTMAELSILAKATVILAAALFAGRAVQSAPVSVRALILASAFAMLLLLPISTLAIPQQMVEIPVANTGAIFVERFARPAEPPVPAAAPASEVSSPPWFITPRASDAGDLTAAGRHARGRDRTRPRPGAAFGTAPPV